MLVTEYGSGFSVVFTITMVLLLPLKLSICCTSETRSWLRSRIDDMFGSKCSGSSRYQIPEVSWVIAPASTAWL